MIQGYEKMLKSSIRITEREDVEICQVTSKLIYDVIYLTGSRSIPLICLDVFLTNFTKTYHMSEIFVKNLK